MFESLWGEPYNTDRERGFSLSPVYPSHLFLHSSPALQLHQSVEWFKWIKETQFALNNFFLICPIYFIQCLNSFLWSVCWKNSSVPSLVVANSSTHMLKLAHCSDHHQVVGSCCAVALEVPVHLAHAKVYNQFFSSTSQILDINFCPLSRSRRKRLKWKLQALVDWWFSPWTLHGSLAPVMCFSHMLWQPPFTKSVRGPHTRIALIQSM